MKNLVLLLLLSFSVQLFAQDSPHKTIGLRGGEMSGITYREFKSDYIGLEAFLTFRHNGIQAGILRQMYQPTLGEVGHNFWFVKGYGAHAGISQSDRFKVFHTEFIYPERKFSPLLGIDGYLALEYRFRDIPLILGVDYKPYFEFAMYDFFSMRLWDSAFTIKYVFE